jgi:hypothetical protein
VPPSEPPELLDRQKEDDGPTYGHLDRTSHKSALWTSLEGHDIHDLLSGLAVLLDNGMQRIDLIIFNTDEKGGVAFTQKASRRTDNREFEASPNEFVGDLALVSAMHDADGELHGKFIITSRPVNSNL